MLQAFKLCLLLVPAAMIQGPPAPQDPVDDDAAPAALLAQLGRAGVQLDLERGMVGVDCSVRVRQDLLEYLLTGPQGSTHETLLVTETLPSLLNTALLLLGIERGQNAAWTPRVPEPTPEEREAGVDPYELTYPSGDGLYLHLAWREGGETYLYRIEDLLNNLHTGRSMRRHRWVYLGSRFAVMRPGEEEMFVADAEQNLVCISFFHEGNTLFTGALPECKQQTIWVPNAWLLPGTGESVQMILSRSPLTELPEQWSASLPEVTPPAPDEPGASEG